MTIGSSIQASNLVVFNTGLCRIVPVKWGADLLLLTVLDLHPAGNVPIEGILSPIMELEI